MKFTVNAEELSRIFNFGSSIIMAAQKSTVELANYFVMQVDENGLGNIQINNPQEGLIAYYETIKVEEPGLEIIPVPFFVDVIKSLKGEITINIDPKTKKGEILSKGTYKFKTYDNDKDNYIWLRNNSEEEKFAKIGSCLATDLATQAERVNFLVNDNTKAALMGIFLHIDRENNISLAGTDGYSLGVTNLEYKPEPESQFKDCIITQNTADFLKKLKIGEMVDLLFDGSRFRIKTDKWQYTSHVINDKFPAYKNVLPRDLEKVYTINKEDLLNCLNMSKPLTEKEVKYVTLDITDGKLTVKANNYLGNAQVEAAAKKIEDYSGGDFSFPMLFERFLLTVKAISTATIRLSYYGKNKPIILAPENSYDFYLTMPKRETAKES